MTRRFAAFIAAVCLVAVQSADAQTVRTGRLMREKLQHAQRILAALTTSDYELLEKEARALTKITENPAWTELMMGELRPYTGSFSKALAELSAAAERRDYEAAGASYAQLTSACFACHKHVMNTRIARAP